ncbi:MAG: response regulator, partial [Nitrospirae bacterium]|nr:response regulator [Nitrospirota bacterium]
MEKLRVLIADSVAPVRNLVKYSLENNYKSIEIDEVSNGSDAQSRLGKKKYDLVLCDWEMPVIGGDELLVWVRKQPDLKTLPFIMLTGNRDKECVERAKEIGVSAYMLKPFTAEKLIQEITSVLDKSERRQFDRF